MARRRLAQEPPPTLHDVAAISGVSKSTVSNVIRGAPHLSPETRARVLRAIEELGYRPNALARDLKRQRTQTVGVVVGDLADPFYSDMTKLLERAASDMGYASIMANTDGDPAIEAERIGLLLEQRVGGLLLLDFTGHEASAARLVAQQTPAVMLTTADERFDSVAVDDEAGIGLAVEHLVALGHTAVAYVAVDWAPSAITRRSAFRTAMQAAGLPDSSVLEWSKQPGRASFEAGTANSSELERLLSGEQPPTALIAYSDVVAAQLLDALVRLDIPVPAAVSVVGFDNLALSANARIDLTTVGQPLAEIAEAGIRLLNTRLRGERGRPEYVKVAPELVMRGTTGPARARG